MDITPDTKVGALLTAHPELEDELVAISPTYRALKNPVLRRTVAKVATLRQVAKVGNVPLGMLIDRLRAAAGLEPLAGEPGEGGPAGPRPEWARSEGAARVFDARVLIEDGGHPMEQVMAHLAELAPGAVYELVTPFVPAPLVDLAAQKGFEAFSERGAPELVRTWFRRR
jgi:hypothetical protein